MTGVILAQKSGYAGLVGALGECLKESFAEHGDEESEQYPFLDYNNYGSDRLPKTALTHKSESVFAHHIADKTPAKKSAKTDRYDTPQKSAANIISQQHNHVAPIQQQERAEDQPLGSIIVSPE